MVEAGPVASKTIHFAAVLSQMTQHLGMHKRYNFNAIVYKTLALAYALTHRKAGNESAHQLCVMGGLIRPTKPQFNSERLLTVLAP